MSDSPNTQDLKSLLPAGVEVALSAQAPDDESGFPDTEVAAMASMQPIRRRDFIHGRTCARAALARLGLPGRAIPVGASREPVWPKGIVGSISHCGPIAAAAAARQEDVSALGIDLETDGPLDSDVLPMICCPDERMWLKELGQPMRIAKMIFSAKESIFKCIWPTVRHFVDFHDVSIRIDIDTGTFAPVEWADGLPTPMIRCIAGRARLRDGWIMTTACIPARASTPGPDSRAGG